MEIEINSNGHKISNNKLKYHFNDITRLKNNTVSLMECIFYSYFENIKSNYSMKIKKMVVFIILILLIVNYKFQI